MSNTFFNSDGEFKPDEKLRIRIMRNLEQAKQTSFSAHSIDRINAYVITIILERAVFEYAPLFLSYAKEKINSNYKNFIFDFSGAASLDSAFIGTILLLQKKIINLGGSLSIVVNYEKTSVVKQLENLNVFLVFPSLEDAIADLNK